MRSEFKQMLSIVVTLIGFAAVVFVTTMWEMDILSVPMLALSQGLFVASVLLAVKGKGKISDKVLLAGLVFSVVGWNDYQQTVAYWYGPFMSASVVVSAGLVGVYLTSKDMVMRVLRDFGVIR